MRRAALVLWAFAVVLQTQAATAETRPPQVIRNAAPEYTDEALSARVQGAVVLKAKIGTDGIPRDIRVVKHMNYGLDDKAVECLSKWRFEPGTRDGVPTAGAVTVEIVFRAPAK